MSLPLGLLLAMGCIVGAPGILYLLRVPILTAIGNFLIVQDPLEPSDIIFLLNGDVAVRPLQVARLINRGIAHTVVIIRAQNSLPVDAGLSKNITDLSIAMMIRSGVPPAQIVELPFPNGVTSTFDEARTLRDYARQNALQRTVVVTSAIHTRRARWIIAKELKDIPVKIMMSPAPDPRFTACNWWRIEEGFLGCQNEYLKFLYYLLKYR